MFGLNLGNLVVHLRANAAQFNQAIGMTETRIKAITAKMKQYANIASTFLVAAGAAFVAYSVKTFAGFDKAMTESTSIMSDAHGKMRQEMEQTARQMSLQTKTSAAELAESYYFLASAGLSAAKSIKALPVVEKFAVAGAFNMAKATDLLTDAQSALGLTVDDSNKNMQNMLRLSDVLVKANTLANASVEQFSAALTNKAAAAMRLLNKDVEEGAAVLAAFADQGVKDVQAGEAFNIMSRDLQRAALKNKQVWKEMGMSVFDEAGKMLNYADIVRQLENRFSSLSDAQKKNTAQMLGFQDRSFSYIQTLIGTSEKIKIYEEELRKAGGTTEMVAKRQMAAFINRMGMLRNQIKDAAIDLGQALSPQIEILGEWLVGTTKKVGNLAKALEELGRQQYIKQLENEKKHPLMQGDSILDKAVLSVWDNTFGRLDEIDLIGNFENQTAVVIPKLESIKKIEKEITEEKKKQNEIAKLMATYDEEELNSLREYAAGIQQAAMSPEKVFATGVDRLNEAISLGLIPSLEDQQYQYQKLQEEYTKTNPKIQKQIEAHEKEQEALNKLKESAKEITESMKTPYEIMEEKIAHVTMLRDKEFISWQTWARAKLQFEKDAAAQDPVKQRAEELISQYKNETQEIKSQIQELQNFADRGLIPKATATRGITALIEKLNEADPQMQKIKKDWEDMQSFAEGIKKSFEDSNPQVKFGRQVEKLEKALNFNMITFEEFAAAYNNAQNELAKAMFGEVKPIKELEKKPLGEAGESRVGGFQGVIARSRIAAGPRTMEEKTLREQQEANRILEQIAVNTGNRAKAYS